ncbi:PilZ domain-containing protein [Paenibacillus kobensis]|uniref:PilZ domain-containing protein n=1 Tax=Paenibacillus kobensis TaxID=59841 RepID=UPI000FD71F29|nr:PilZ domain-containing protein [Paenibacillus kobensis]
MSIKGGNEVLRKEKELIAPKALVHSRTIVEKQDYVTTGISTYVEGELLGIDLNEYKRFELGDSVQLTFYSPVGIHRLQSTIIGKDEGSIAVIFPPKAFQFVEKRESPRVQVEAYGRLRVGMADLTPIDQMKLQWSQELSVEDLDEGLLARLEQLIDSPASSESLVSDKEEEIEEGVIPISIRNISTSGIGFVVERSTFVPLAAGDSVAAELRIEGQLPLPCKLVIVRSEDRPEGRYYGARIEEIRHEQQRTLRAYILREQVNMFYRNRNKKMGSAGGKI